VQTFKAYRTFEQDKAVTSRFVEMKVDALDAGDVVIRTKYSTINYKDALSYNGSGRIMRKYPTNAGIDMAGTVESSTDARWKRSKIHARRSSGMPGPLSSTVSHTRPSRRATVAATRPPTGA
jgi:NADPH:quinone reductase-like Zn-dependent oxidoreductase